MTKVSSDTEGKDEFVKEVVVAMYLTNGGQSWDTIEQGIEAYKRVHKDYSVGEIKALGQLYNRENPMTFAGVISSDYKIVRLVFLEKMGELKDDLEQLSDEELMNLIVAKLSNESFKKRAKERFFIER